MIKNNEFSKLFPKITKLPQVDVIRDTFKVIDYDSYHHDGNAIKKIIQNNKSPWAIENSIFNNLKCECGLEHCFLHGGKQLRLCFA